MQHRRAASGGSLTVYDSPDCIKAGRKRNKKERADSEPKFQCDGMRFVRLFPDRPQGAEERGVGKGSKGLLRGITIPCENVTLIGRANPIDANRSAILRQRLFNPFRSVKNNFLFLGYRMKR